MTSDQEKFDRVERAKRLKWAREEAGFSGPKPVIAASPVEINENVYKAHEQGRNGFTVSDARVYADLFQVSLAWLYLGIGLPKETAASPEAHLRSALIAYGVDREDLGRAISAVKIFIDDDDEQLISGPTDDQFEPSSPRRVSEPSE